MFGTMMPETNLSGTFPRIVVKKSRCCRVKYIDSLPAAGTGVAGLDVSIAEENISHSIIVIRIDKSSTFAGTCMIIKAVYVITRMSAASINSLAFCEDKELFEKFE